MATVIVTAGNLLKYRWQMIDTFVFEEIYLHNLSRLDVRKHMMIVFSSFLVRSEN